jgi:hypothetical protein
MVMIYHVKSPNEYTGDEKTLFLAGGITGCPDWQSELFELLQMANLSTNLVPLNPRRKAWDMAKDKAEDQIAWEFKYLSSANLILFWFPKETLCPIVLFELGKYAAATNREVFVGVEPGYKREFDVRFQMHLARPEVLIVDSLDELPKQIGGYLNG